MKRKILSGPKNMNIKVMQNILLGYMKNNELFYFNQEFAICLGSDFLSKILKLSGPGPFLVEDYRMGILQSGEIDFTVNMVKYHLTAGQMVFIGRGAILHINYVSQDAIIKGVILSVDIVNQLSFDKDSPLTNSSGLAFFYGSSDKDRIFLYNVINTIMKLVSSTDPLNGPQEDYPKEVLNSLIEALFNYYNNLYSISLQLNPNESTLFNKFLSLIQKYSKTERSVSFYAEKMCLTPRYFSTLILEQSGKTAKCWIDSSVQSRAEVMLRYSSKTVSEISAELNFPNDSFFCKFFRRMTGCSPTEYRNKS